MKDPNNRDGQPTQNAQVGGKRRKAQKRLFVNHNHDYILVKGDEAADEESVDHSVGDCFADDSDDCIFTTDDEAADAASVDNSVGDCFADDNAGDYFTDVPPSVGDTTDDYDEFDDAFDDESDEFDPFSDKLCEELAYSTRKCPRCDQQFEWNSAFSAVHETRFCKDCEQRHWGGCTCVDCGREVDKMKAFPKGNTEWCKDDKLSNWCEACWGKFVRTRMLPRENERIVAKRKNQDPGNKHSLVEDPCKECGAMTHKTLRSRFCPFNKKYADFSHKDNNTAVATASASPSAVITKTVNRKPCDKCGSMTHKTMRSKKCPFHENYKCDKPCDKCGSMTHKTARSKKCPFNENYEGDSVVTTPKVSPSTANTESINPVHPRKFGGKAPRNTMHIAGPPTVNAASAPETSDVVNTANAATAPETPDVVNTANAATAPETPVVVNTAV